MTEKERYQLDFDNAKNALEDENIKDIYEKETGYPFDKNRQTACVFCGSGTHDNKNSDGALTYYPSINLLKCYACGNSFNSVSILKHQHNINYKECIEYYSYHYKHTELKDPNSNSDIKKLKPANQNVTVSKKKIVSEEEKIKENQEKELKFNYILSLIIEEKESSEIQNYLISRALDLSVLPENSYYQNNSYRDLPASVVFIDSENKLINQRYVSNDLPEKVAKSRCLGDLNNAVYDCTFKSDHNRIYITEGVINALSIFQCSYSAISLFASSNKLSNVDKFKAYFNEKDIVIAYDTDKAGIRAAFKLASFIDKFFSAKSIGILIFPKKGEKALDSNDLLKENSLTEHLRNHHNYYLLNSLNISIELNKIEKDNNYVPNLLHEGYYNRERLQHEENGSFLFEKIKEIPEDIINKLKGSNELCSKTLTDLGIIYLKSYTVFDSKKAHIYLSTEENPIFLQVHLSYNVIWRPFACKPFKELTLYSLKKEHKLPDTFYFGLQRIRVLEKDFDKTKAVNEILDEEDGIHNSSKAKKNTKPFPSITIAYSVIDCINLFAIDMPAIYTESKRIDFDIYQELEGFADKIYNIPHTTQCCKLLSKSRALYYINIETFFIPKDDNFSTVSEYLKFVSVSKFKRLLNTALPYRFWEFNKGEYEIDVIKLRHFLNGYGYYTYKAPANRGGYWYIKIDNRKVAKYDPDKENVSRMIRYFVDDYLQERGEITKLRNKIAKATELNEMYLSGLKQKNLDFNNSGKNYQNWFFSDGNMWTVTLNGIKKHKQTDLKKYIWEDDILNFKSDVLESPFTIWYTDKYLKAKEIMDATEIETEAWHKARSDFYAIENTEKYDIEFHDKDFYFSQFIFLTSFIEWEEYESKHGKANPALFWDQLKENNMHDETIKAIKLHVINKITYLGYVMKDYREPDEQFGWAVLDMLDPEASNQRKGASGGGKSLIGTAIAQVKRTLNLKAEQEDFPENKHRYENYGGEKVIILNDMHSRAHIGNMLTDFSEGIEVNPKHKRPIAIPFAESPKLIINRNYMDDEGERVDRRLGRSFVVNYFHDNKSERFKERRTPVDVFGKMFFADDTDLERSKLVNFFAYAYIAYQKFGAVSPPMDKMQLYRLAFRIGDPLINYLDEYFEDPLSYGYVERVPLYEEFTNKNKIHFSQFDRHRYNTSQKFKQLVADYCKLRNLIFNPDHLINKRNPDRIFCKSNVRMDKNGLPLQTEFFYINTKSGYEYEFSISNTKEEEIFDVKQMKSLDDIPF